MTDLAFLRVVVGFSLNNAEGGEHGYHLCVKLLHEGCLHDFSIIQETKTPGAEGLSELRRRLEDSLPDGLVLASSPPKDIKEKNLLNNIPRPPALPMGPLVDPQGLILPRKPFNPCLDSKDRQDLHRELLFNQRIGKNVLNQKSELQRALEKHRDLQTKRELENEKNQNKSLLERVIEERARRIENLEKKEEDTSRLPEFMQVHARLKSSSNKDSK